MPITLGTPATGLVLPAWDGSAWVVTLSVTIAPGDNMLFVGIATGLVGISNMTFNSVSLGSAKVSLDDGNQAAIWFFDLLAPSVGTFSLRFNTGNQTACRVIAIPLSGVDATTPRGTPVSASAFNTNATVTAATTAGDMVLDLVYAQAAVTVGAGQTQVYNVDTYIASSYEVATGTSTVMNWSLASNRWVTGAIPYKPAAASGPTPTPAFGRYGVRSPSR